MKKRKIRNYNHDEVLYKYIKCIYRGDGDETQYIDNILWTTRTVRTDVSDYFLCKLVDVLMKYEGGQKCISLLSLHLKSINVPLDIRRKIAKEIFEEKKRIYQLIWNTSNALLHLDERLGNEVYQNLRVMWFEQYVQKFLH